MGAMTSPYCETLPGQLRAWDATALRMFQECPRKYQLCQLEGWRKKDGGIHIEFGSLYHEACEMFDKRILAGETKEAATWETFKHTALSSVGKLETHYLPVWRCSDPAEQPGVRDPSKLVKNTKRCARAKADQFDGHRGGEPCCDCGLPTVDDFALVAPNKNKNRDTLVRSVLYYCDTADDRVRPYAFPDGRPAVELTFRLPLPLISPDGTPYLLTGNLDSMVTLAGETMPRERKTTKGTPGSFFFDRYAPDTQIDTYDLACWALFSDLLDPKPHGIMVEVTQITANFTRIERQIINVPEERREEWLREVQWWIAQAESCAREEFWPKNTAACNGYGGEFQCPMREICRMAPSSRARFLPGEKYEKRQWNPLEIR